MSQAPQSIWDHIIPSTYRTFRTKYVLYYRPFGPPLHVLEITTVAIIIATLAHAGVVQKVYIGRNYTISIIRSQFLNSWQEP